MKARSVVAGVLVAGAMVVGGAGSASANLVWCASDPPVQVQTPDGANLMVNVLVTVPQHQAKYIGDVATHWITEPDQSGGGRTPPGDRGPRATPGHRAWASP